MATKKKLLQAAAGSASGGAGGLNVEQVFSTYLYEGNGSAQVIENGINLGQSNGSGSVYFNDPNAGYPIPLSSTISFASGDDWTVEAWICRKDESGNPVIIANDYGVSGTGNQIGVNASSDYIQYYDNSSVLQSSSQPISFGTWYHVAYVKSGSTIYFWVNGVSAGTSSSSNAADFKTIGALGGYTAGASWWGWMADLRVSNNARYTSAFTPPTSALSTDANTVLLCLQSDDPFTDKTGNRTLSPDNSVVSTSTFGPFDAADAGEGGLVWTKGRTQIVEPILVDTERGVQKYISTDRTNAEGTNSSILNAFNSNGFSIGGSSFVNSSGQDYASWTFRKAPKFFDVVTYTGTGSAQNISHDLGATVGTLIVKRTDSADNWTVWHRGVNSGSGSSFLNLNLTSGYSNSASRWNSTAPTSTQFSVGTHASVNASGGTYVAYLFAHNDGDGDFGPTGDQDIIKCGSYTEPASGSQTINLGFEPQFLLLKISSGTGSWQLVDTMRGITDNTYVRLEPNASSAESTFSGGYIYPHSTGFTASSGFFGSGAEVIYIAIRRGPMAVPTDATDVFAQGFAPSSGEYIVNAGFPVDAVIYTATGGLDNYNFDRMRGNPFLLTNTTAAESASIGAFDSNTSFRLAGFAQDSSTYINWMWRRAPSFCDVVAYTGNGTTRTINHNLGVAPEMVWVKNRGATASWAVYHKDVGNNKALVLDQTGASFNANWWNSTTPTDSLFYIGGDEATVNTSSNTYIAYLFASLDGVSKVGSYTGTGTSQTIDCGFSSGARFVLIKRTDSTSDWWVFDTARGIVAGNDSLLALNGNAAEGTGYDNIDPDSSGFIINNTAWNENASGGSYIFYAVA